MATDSPPTPAVLEPAVPPPLRVMVASSVYGFEESLDQIVGTLRTYGYRLLSAFGQAPRMAFRELRTAVGADQSDQAIRNDLIDLRTLGLVESQGHGRGASWRTARIAPPQE